MYKSLQQDPFDTHHILLFIPILNFLLCNILSEAVLLGKSSKSLKAMSLHGIFFFHTSSKDGLSKKIALESDLSCIIGKDYISFSRQYDLTPRCKMKDDLSQKNNGNMIFTSNVLKRWFFQKGPRLDMIFLVASGKIVASPRKHGISSLDGKRE